MSEEFETSVRRIFAQVGLGEYSEGDRARRFARLVGLLSEFNRQTNLTAITDPEEIILRHFADSVTVAPFLPRGGRVVDVGTGGGFPALPLAIVRPDLRIVALDSVEKKLEFVASAAQTLGLDNLRCQAGRAEVLGRDAPWREGFDCAVSRAVARMSLLCELCLPLVRPGGCFAALKGPEGVREREEAERAVALLGGEFASAEEFELDSAGSRCILLCRKISPTPHAYPRAYAKMKRSPL